MSHSPEFSRWQPSTDLSLPSASTTPYLVQIKVHGRLLSYPKGKSAMVWYGTAAAAAEIADRLKELAPRWSDDVLVWRWRPSEAPHAELVRLLGRFERRFGTAPVENDT